MIQDWPYAEDGVARDVFCESLRLPLIGNPYPRWCYITAVVVPPPDEPGWRGVRPTDDELRVVASYHEAYCAYWYRESWKRRMAERPFDVDCAANGRYVIKYEHGGWAYRHASWREGPCFIPSRRDEPTGLVAVLDREQTLCDEPRPQWQQWKADHAEVFAAVTR